jgi:hypothetical protein
MDADAKIGIISYAPSMKIQKSTARYEEWLAEQLTIVPADLQHKHEQMSAALFPFMRATYYRWAQIWPEVCGTWSAPVVLGVGDLHVENFGTWRDSEGRLIWGINDFDETWRLPYTHDLVRLAASAHIAISENHLALDLKEAAAAILEGYAESLAAGGRPFVLAEHHALLRNMAVHRLKDVCSFWEKLERCQPVKGRLPDGAAKGISRMLPDPELRGGICTAWPAWAAWDASASWPWRSGTPATSRAKPRPWLLRHAGGPPGARVRRASSTRRSWIPRCVVAIHT